MKIILYGTLAKRFGSEHSINTDVPAEAIEGLSRQLPDWPRDLVIDVVGLETPEKLLSPTEETEIHLLPRMYGGGGKWGTILLGAALIGTAILTGGGSLGFLGLALSKSTLILMGATMMLSGISQIFMKAPTVDKSKDPDASKYLGISTNTTQIGTLMKLGWGRHRLTGHWLSLQSDSSHLVHASFPANPT